MLALHRVAARCTTGAFNTNCTEYGEDCDGCWLSGGSSLVVRALAAQTVGPRFDS